MVDNNALKIHETSYDQPFNYSIHIECDKERQKQATKVISKICKSFF